MILNPIFILFLQSARAVCELATPIRALDDSTALSSNGPSPPTVRLLPRQTNFSLPGAFDGDLGNNFTQSTCLPWLVSFLAGIEPCHPVSLMLQTSISYFDATRNIFTISEVLNASCGVDHSQCSSLLSSYTSQILDSNVCLDDYRLGNPIVTQAYTGLLAYDSIYAATCLTANSSTGPYCYAEAVTNTSNPSAAYIYYLPLGVSLPASMAPTCNYCLQHTMQDFQPYASMASQPLSKTYPGAASQLDISCGPGFVDQNVVVESAAAATSALVLGVWTLMVLFGGTAIIWLAV